VFSDVSVSESGFHFPVIAANHSDVFRDVHVLILMSDDFCFTR